MEEHNVDNFDNLLEFSKNAYKKINKILKTTAVIGLIIFGVNSIISEVRQPKETLDPEIKREVLAKITEITPKEHAQDPFVDIMIAEFRNSKPDTALTNPERAKARR